MVSLLQVVGTIASFPGMMQGMLLTFCGMLLTFPGMIPGMLLTFCGMLLTFPGGTSLMAGLEYGMERWNGKWNGTVNGHSYTRTVANVCNWHCSVYVEPPSGSLGLLSHRRSFMNKYGIAHRHASACTSKHSYLPLLAHPQMLYLIL